MSSVNRIPVIAIDGPSGVGKTTIASLLAEKFAYHILVSGFLYRVLAWLSLKNKIVLDDVDAVTRTLAECIQLGVRFEQSGTGVEVYLGQKNLSHDLLEESCAGQASRLAGIPALRRGLVSYQRSFARTPGLVAEGRDMGTVIFPEARLKIFLIATLEERAKRRYEQLKNQRNDGTLTTLIKQLELRDKRDKERAIAPLVQAQDATMIDTTHKTIDQVINQIVQLHQINENQSQ